MAYVLVEQSVIDALSQAKEFSLTPQEVQAIVLHKQTIKKFLLQKAFSVQTEIGAGTHRGSEEVWHSVATELAKAANDIDGLELRYAEWQLKTNAENLQSENNE